MRARSLKFAFQAVFHVLVNFSTC